MLRRTLIHLLKSNCSRKVCKEKALKCHEENFPDKIDQCEFVASNCLEALLNKKPTPEITKVFCNPPFHQQNAITGHIAWQMFQDARECLVKSGHLIVVGNRHLEYHIKLKRLFGGAKVIASDNKFVVLGTAKR